MSLLHDKLYCIIDPYNSKYLQHNKHFNRITLHALLYYLIPCNTVLTVTCVTRVIIYCSIDATTY